MPSPSGTVTPDHFFMDSARSPNGAAISAIAPAPNPENVLSNPPRAVSPRAPAIAVKPCPISSQSIVPNFLSASARSPSPCTPRRSEPLPMSAPSPPKLPSRPETTASSVSDPPIPTSPLVISSHVILPNFLSASARSPSPCTPSKIAPPAITLPKPAKFPSKPRTVPSSAKAPPIPTSPFPISSQDIPPIRERAVAIGSKACTATRIPVAPRSEPNPPTALRMLNDAVNSPNAPPIAANPCPISSHDKEPSFFKFSEISSSDCTATRIPVPPRSDPKPPTALRALRATVNSPSAPPIAAKP